MAEHGNFKNNKRGKNKKGMTQQQLADSVYVTRQTISKWELGKSISDEASLDLLYQCWKLTMRRKRYYRNSFIISKLYF